MLLSPGPVPVPEFVMRAIAQPVMHHRGPAFGLLMENLRHGLRYLFQTEADTCLMCGSGTIGVETAMYSLFQPADRVLVLNFGKFSERWVDYGKLIGLDIVNLPCKWGKHPTLEDVLEVAASYPDLNGVVLTHCETSTGACIDVEEIAFAFKQKYPKALLVVDGISTIGAMPFYMDDWQIDCAVVASQKALMNPAGTVAFAMSELAQSRLRPTHPADSRNLHNYLRLANQNSFPYTPPVQLFYGWKAVLDHIKTKGLPTVWNQAHQSAQIFRAGIVELNGAGFADSPSDSMTAFCFDQIDHETIRKQLLEQYGIFLAAGQGALKGKIMRIAHMGEANEQVMIHVLEKLKEVLKQFG